MAERDRITRLEYDLARISRQIAGMPVRIARSGGGSRSDTLTVSFGVVTTEIAAATGDTSEITPGTGDVQGYDTDPDTFIRTPNSNDPVTVYNYDPGMIYPVGTVVYLGYKENRGTLEVISAACTVLSAPA